MGYEKGAKIVKGVCPLSPQAQIKSVRHRAKEPTCVRRQNISVPTGAFLPCLLFASQSVSSVVVDRFNNLSTNSVLFYGYM